MKTISGMSGLAESIIVSGDARIKSIAKQESWCKVKNEKVCN